METASSNETRPYLSVVVTARNDDHGGNLLRRMQTFVNALLAQAKRHDVALELVVVDWNPPPAKPPLIDALQWPSDLGPVEVRFVEVPPSLHATYRHAEALPLYQMIAKNVGIRRAKGRFVLVTNIDVVFSHELFEIFAQKHLEPGRMYRVDRYDAMEEVPVDASIDEQLRYCEQNLIRINTRQGTFPVTPAGQRLLEPGDITSPEGGISFGKGWYTLEGGPDEKFRWALNEAEIFAGPLREARRLVLELEPGPGVGFSPFSLRVTDGGGKMIHEIGVMKRQRVTVELPPSREPAMIRLQVLGGGQQVVHDPRVLNFRAFSVEWEHASESGDPRTPGDKLAGAASLRKPLGQQQPRGEWSLMGVPRGVWNTFSKLRTATGPVEIGVPVPRFMVDRCQLRLQGDSLVATVDPAWLRPWRRQPAPAKPRDIVPDGLHMLWGQGWFPQENFRGEQFRWASDSAELIVHTPEGEPTTLRLLVEPGPALGYGAFHLRAKDDSGKTFATATINGRQWIDLPLRWRPNGTQVVSLHTHGDTAARALPNDPRTLHFRILACGWAGAKPSPRETANATPAKQPWMPLAQSPGVFLGAGWEPDFSQDGGPPGWIGCDDAEIVVRRSAAGNGVLRLMVEPPAGSGIDLLVHAGGQPLLKRHLHDRQEFRLPLPLSEGQTGVVRVRAGKISDGPSPSSVRLVSAAWDIAGFKGREEPALVADREQAENPAAPCGPAFLHTNACGDFTLLARENWFDLRGYPEFDVFSMNLDSVFCYAAHHGGAPEELLPDSARIYHIEHATGSGFTPEGQVKLFERIAAKGIPWIDYQQVLDWAIAMRRLQAPLIFNLENWGLAAMELPERNLLTAAQAGPSKHTTRSV